MKFIYLCIMLISIGCSMCACRYAEETQTKDQPNVLSIEYEEDKACLELDEGLTSIEENINDNELITSPESAETLETTIISVESAAKYDASTIKSVQENRCGLIMQVPTCFYNDLACNTDERTLFAFSDLTTQNITNYAGNVWSIFTLNEKEFLERYGIDVTSFPEKRIDAAALLIGKDEDNIYILTLSSDLQFDPTSPKSLESYYLHHLYGYTMLSDFLLCNRIQENPYWKMEYLTQLQKLGMITGDFLTTEYGLGIINNSDASLQKEAFQIANLAVYDGDNELGWNDLLLYKLLTLEHSSVTGEQELSTLEIYRMMVFDETMLEYADTLLGKILSIFFLELEDDPRLSDLCMQSDWILIEQDGKYELQILNKEQNMVHSFQVE